jgi:ribonucleoside-diphosphate reductase alpha chain
MLEQEKRPSENQTGSDSQNATQLEGIRQKVFTDRYSLKDASGQALEFYPEQMWARVARGIAAVEQTEEKRAEWEEKFYNALSDFKFVPGGRILAGAGTGHQVTYYNCMPPDQEVLTANGYRPISEIKIGDLVVTHRNRLRPVLHKFERETEETLYIIRPKKVGYDDLRLTGDHKVYVIRSEWVNKHRSRDGLRLQQEPAWIPAKELKPGDYVAVAHNGEESSPEIINLQDYVSGYATEDGKLFKETTRGAHGYVSSWGTHYKVPDSLKLDGDLCYLLGRWLGDGCVTHRTGTDIPSGIKIVFSLDEKEEAQEIARIVETKFGIDGSIKLSSTERWYDLWINSMPIGEFFKAFLGCYSYNKQIPDQLMHLPTELTLELLRGLFSADGYVSDNKLGIVLANRTLTTQIHQLLLRLGYLFSIRENTHRLGRVPAYRLQATSNECGPLFERFFGVQAPEHNVDLKYYFEYDDLKWVRINEIAVEDYSGTVLDIEVEEDHSFISAGVVVSNCFVIPSPEDSRQGILDNLKLMTEIMARGGGVGINLSTLRPRGSYIKTVNGTASGPCSWAQLYSVATGDVIQQGGCFGPDERIATDKGLIPAKELADRLDGGEAIQAQTHKGLRPFTYVFRNGIKDLYEVTTTRGYHVRVTLDHKMAVRHNGEITTIALKNLKEGDEILLLLGEGRKAEANPDTITSITPAGPSEVFDFEVEEVHLLAAGSIYSSNSRRGALMLMLDDTHPDIEEFITVKKQAGKIEHANLSVCVSDAFMQAVKDDTDWNLTWQGEVKKTVRARKLWDLICTSAWESAEPGVVFMDRYNKESNTWYYENIRCVNPCVTGDTLIYTDRGLLPAKELAEQGTPVTIVSPNVAIKDLALAGITGGREQITQVSAEQTLRQASHVFPTGFKSVYRLQTTEGYTVRLTQDHKVLTEQGWKEAGKLVHGDKILLLNSVGAFGNTGSADLGKVMGWLVGDGYINTKRQGSIVLSFFGTERVIAPQFAEAVNRLVTAPEANQRLREYPVGTIDITSRNETRVESTRLLHLIDPALRENKLQVPPSVLRGSREMQQGFLSALFTADGSIQGTLEKGISVRLTSISQELLEGVQRLLLNFGIASCIYKERRKQNTRELPDGKGNYATYNCSPYHDLMISRSNLPLFAQHIGFLTTEKQGKLEELLASYKRKPYQKKFVATFEKLTPDGEETVYDLTEPEMHLFVANGLIVHNCGEQGLPPFGVCNLGALNLSSFVKNGKMDYEQLAEISKISMRFLDNVVDANEYFIPENRDAQMGTRRTGLGTMGLADALIKMKIAYGSEESIPVIERIYSTIRDAAYDASADNAAEKGVFPNFDRDKYMQGKFIKRLPKQVQEKIKKHGTRNAVLLTQAPTGTTSLLAGASSGIEPVYDFAMIRRDRTGEHILYHPLLQEWRDKHPNEPTPQYFVSSKDLTPEEHVRVQAMIQRYTDSSISKTVNAPNNHTVEQVETLYRLAYEMGCKGVTYYRDGSRDAVLTRIEDEKKAAEQKAAEATPMIEPVTSIHQGIKRRPDLVQGYTRQVRAPEGKINITINSDEQGPLEVFVNLGKAGSDIAALSEALGRLISLNLQILSPLSQTDRAKVIAEQLRGIGGSRSVGFGAQQVRSLPDGVARALELHLESLQQTDEDTSNANENSNRGNLASQEEHNEEEQSFNALNLSNLTVTGNLCPQCGCNTMVYEEGCRKCYSCGHSEC